jgi:hypothetical protein
MIKQILKWLKEEPEKSEEEKLKDKLTAIESNI